MDDKNIFEIEDVIESIILVGIDSRHQNIEQNLYELEDLVKTTGAEVVGKMTQSMDRPNPKTYINSGKLDELKDYINLVDATGIVCDDELSPNQLRYMSDYLKTKVMDRTMVILDIFANRASSSEGKAQVELAQLKYDSVRLIGLGISMAKQTGGIGARRGVGEKKLELDRRNIKDRIVELERELSKIKVQRKTQREHRIRKGIEVISLVGYTNAGKSTLMNTLTSADVLSEDKLFATLDTTTRKLQLPSSEVLLTDTVGFIQKLPHTLIEAFNATLEELQYADLLIHVVDISNENYFKQMQTVYKTLEELHAGHKPILTVFNKIDLVDDNVQIIFKDDKAINTIKISAEDGTNIEKLLNEVERILNDGKNKIHVLIPYSDGDMLSLLHNEGNIISEDHTENGTEIKATVNEKLYNQMEEYKL